MKSFRTLARARARSTKNWSLQRIGSSLLVFYILTSFSALSPLQAFAAGQAGLTWTGSTGAYGYRVYYGTSSGNYTQNIDVGNVTNYTVTSLANGSTYYFAAKAYDASGNLSSFSNEVSKTLSSTFTITATASANGTITAANNSNVTTSSSGTSVVSTVTVSSGASQTFSITPNSGYYVASVTADGASVGAVTSYTFSNVTANHTLSATFAANSVNTYTLTASAGTGGSISPSGSVNVNSGGSQMFTITPGSGYKISSVTVDGSSVGAVSTYTFSNVTANHTIAASFSTTTASSYTISASAGTGGSISPSGTKTVTSGGSQTYTITPASGYTISSVTVDGASVGAVSSYAFSNVTANHTISATFAAASSGGGSTTTGSGIWPASTVPKTADAGPDSAVELGVKFTTDTNGYITGIRFYKGTGNTGTHVGNIWSSSGQLLATATFTGETASGWQQVNFSTPVAVTANTTYVASYHTNVGHYSDDMNYFTAGVNNAPLHTPTNAGVYAYGSTSAFPSQTWSNSNYWVDVVYHP